MDYFFEFLFFITALFSILTIKKSNHAQQKQ